MSHAAKQHCFQVDSPQAGQRGLDAKGRSQPHWGQRLALAEVVFRSETMIHPTKSTAKNKSA
jgi:hypothetical protein